MLVRKLKNFFLFVKEMEMETYKSLTNLVGDFERILLGGSCALLRLYFHTS